jgi:hypothetical protein
MQATTLRPTGSEDRPERRLGVVRSRSRFRALDAEVSQTGSAVARFTHACTTEDQRAAKADTSMDFIVSSPFWASRQPTDGLTPSSKVAKQTQSCQIGRSCPRPGSSNLRNKPNPAIMAVNPRMMTVRGINPDKPAIGQALHLAPCSIATACLSGFLGIFEISRQRRTSGHRSCLTSASRSERISLRDSRPGTIQESLLNVERPTTDLDPRLHQSPAEHRRRRRPRTSWIAGDRGTPVRC